MHGELSNASVRVSRQQLEAKAGQQSGQHDLHLGQGEAVADAHEGASTEREEGVRVIVLQESLGLEAVWVRPVF